MILSILLGYVIARTTNRRYLTPVAAVVAGVIIGIVSALFQTPLVYPFFVIRGTGVIIPEFRELVICVFIPEFQLFSDVVPMWFPYSAILATLMAGFSLLGSVLGWWIGKRPAEPDTPWPSDGVPPKT